MEKDTGVGAMKPFYICQLCNSIYSQDYLNEHNLSVCSMELQPEDFCYVELHPAFYVTDIKSMIENQMSHEKQYESIAQSQLATIEAASSLNTLRELLETVDGKVK